MLLYNRDPECRHRIIEECIEHHRAPIYPSWIKNRIHYHIFFQKDHLTVFSTIEYPLNSLENRTHRNIFSTQQDIFSLKKRIHMSIIHRSTDWSFLFREMDHSSIRRRVNWSPFIQMRSYSYMPNTAQLEYFCTEDVSIRLLLYRRLLNRNSSTEKTPEMALFYT